VMEGMAASRPMVVTAVGGNPELIADGERGLVVKPGAPDELAAAFARLLADRKAAARMGRRARAFVERELSLRKMVEAHEALYFQVARGSVEQAQAA
jgi:glycosyltransferase involved in cell wall biosynthesis